MKGMRMAALVLLTAAMGTGWGQNSSVLKSATKFLPSLTEIGFVTGAINTYIQTATLVRAVNKEIALAKSMSKRLDDLKGETEQMLGRFGSLSNINPYDMDSWASWLDRAQGLATEETSDFLDILFNSVLKTVDERMTTGFYAEVQKGLSYDASQGRVGEVLRAYYMNRAYEENREKIRGAAVNSRKLRVLLAQRELADTRTALTADLPPAIRSLMNARVRSLEKQVADLEAEILDPSRGGTAVDRQIAFLTDLAGNLGTDIAMAGEALERHQKDLAALNREWELASKDRLPKSKDRGAVSSAFTMDRSLYDATNPDKVPQPVNDVEKPAKQNTSEGSAPTTLSDLLQLQNKIDLAKLEIAEDALRMELQVGEARATLVALTAYAAESRRNVRVAAGYGMENLVQVLE